MRLRGALLDTGERPQIAQAIVSLGSLKSGQLDRFELARTASSPSIIPSLAMTEGQLGDIGSGHRPGQELSRAS